MNICKSDECTSCLACLNVCPFNAIEFKKNSLSEIKPAINTEKCRGCERCKKVCPVLNKPSFYRAKTALALYTKHKYYRETCASGGVATTLGKAVIEEDGVVFGAAVIGGKCKFISVETVDDLELLKGSKYVYCSPELIYREVLKSLKSKRICLFIGTPCQVAGLKNYIGKEYCNLILIDLICHGTPPFDYLKQHLDHKLGRSIRVERITFRGSNDFYLCAYDNKSNCLYRKKQNEDEYFTSFMKGIIFQNNCYNCQYAIPKRVSDITIGDFWGLEKTALNGYQGKKSVALLNTPKGETFIKKHLNLFIYEYRDPQEAINGNDQLRHPSDSSHSRIKFIQFYTQTNDFEKSIKQIGVVSLTRKNVIVNRVLFIPRLIKHKLRSLL